MGDLDHYPLTPSERQAADTLEALRKFLRPLSADARTQIGRIRQAQPGADAGTFTNGMLPHRDDRPVVQLALRIIREASIDAGGANIPAPEERAGYVRAVIDAVGMCLRGANEETWVARLQLLPLAAFGYAQHSDK